jgi:outer membrane protein OmpA-like peptidoglycan-associated protein
MTLNLRKRSIVWGLWIGALTLPVSICSAALPQEPSTHAEHERAEGAARKEDRRVVYVMVDRSVKAVKYAHRSGSTKINFEGTSLMSDARGEAKVDSHRGAMEIKVEFENIQRPTSFGPEYLTYVMWAISPEGRPVNLGEVLIGENHRSKLDVTTDLQAFALIVTAEPYYAVRRPSNVVVLENVIRPDTVGSTEIVDAKYELIDRGGYIPTGYKYERVEWNDRLPLEFFEARNALRIAESSGAEHFAAESYQHAEEQMKQADELASRHDVDKKRLSATSRLVVQTAEDAREIAVKRMDSDRADSDRRDDANRVASAKAETRNAKAETRSAEAVAADAARAREEAERRARESNESARNAAAGQARAEKDTDDARRGQQAAQADADRNRDAAMNSDQQLQKALREREELRARLLIQFNAILETRDTARGLVVNMSDVLFDSAKFTLRPMAREKLAKISGIVLAYPSLSLAIEGNTDSVGGEDYNQQLSENRAGSVRDYLVQEGVPTNSMSVHGFGKSQPVASNETADGRQQNRRVELVVSGDVIGTVMGSGPAAMEVLPVRPH